MNRWCTSNACKQNKENGGKEPNTHRDVVVVKQRGHQEHREDSCQRAMHHLKQDEINAIYFFNTTFFGKMLINTYHCKGQSALEHVPY